MKVRDHRLGRNIRLGDVPVGCGCIVHETGELLVHVAVTPTIDGYSRYKSAMLSPTECRVRLVNDETRVSMVDVTLCIGTF